MDFFAMPLCPPGRFLEIHFFRALRWGTAPSKDHGQVVPDVEELQQLQVGWVGCSPHPGTVQTCAKLS